MTEEELQELADHYFEVQHEYYDKHQENLWDWASFSKMWYYLGKRETCLDLIKKMEDEA